MSTIVREVVKNGMPKKLADEGWTLEKNDGTPPRFHAVHFVLNVDLGPYPQMGEAQDAAWGYKPDESTANSEQQTAEPDIPAEVREMFPDQEIHKLSLEPGSETIELLASAPPLANSATEAADETAISVLDEIGDNQLFPVDLVRADSGIQPRAALDMNTVAEYAEAMRGGAVFPPVDVFYDAKDYWLADGFHRLQATKEAEIEEIHANVHVGTQRDALLFSLGANATHGLPRTNADKRRAVTTMLMDEEWTRKSDGEIARETLVSQPFVSALRRELTTQNVLSEQTTRVGADGVARDTSNIGRRSEADIEEEREANPELFESTANSEQQTAGGGEETGDGSQETEVRTCMVCGCTDDNPCEGGCSWVSDHLCSTCHDWHKVSLFTESGGYDKYRCERCGATGKRWGVSWPPALDKKQPAKCKAEEGEPRSVTKSDEPEEITVTDKRRFADQAETRSGASESAAKAKPTLEQLAKGKPLLMIAFTIIPAIKGKVQVTVNTSNDRKKATRKLIDSDKVRGFSEDVHRIISEHLGVGPKSSTRKAVTVNKKSAAKLRKSQTAKVKRGQKRAAVASKSSKKKVTNKPAKKKARKR